MGSKNKAKMAEKEFVEQELSSLMELTIRLEDELNQVCSNSRE